jgi:hypothetical protein
MITSRTSLHPSHHHHHHHHDESSNQVEEAQEGETYDHNSMIKEGDDDAASFRHAIWYYVHRIYGICHDDYDYRNVNIVLNRPTKAFVKKVACTPWRVTREDLEHFNETLSSSETCHVTLLAAEARKQAGLIYGLRAVMQYFLT